MKNNTPEGSYFWFESNHDPWPSTHWLQDYGVSSSVALSLGYLVAIYSGQWLMKDAQRKEMKGVLLVWNTACAVFAAFGAYRMVPELIWTLWDKGFKHSVCVADFALRDPTSFWTELFLWSKAVELVDTVFLVLRKRPVIFLHWYHHVTVMLYTWHACREHAASGRWFISMNYTVHALMYAYYALRTAGFNKLPKFIPMTLTSLQLSQMIVGCYISASVYWLKTSGQECGQSLENLYFCFLIYFTYGLLFARFFWEAYLKPRASRDPKKIPTAPPCAPQPEETQKKID